MTLNRGMPVLLLVGAFALVPLILGRAIHEDLGQFLGYTLAGIAVGSGFGLLGWYSQQQTVRGSNVRLKLWISRHAVWSHIIYASVVFVGAALLAGGEVFGITFTDGPTRYVAIAGIGAFCGLMMTFALEFDAGLDSGGGPTFWFALVFTVTLLGLLFVLISPAGGFLFIAAMLVARGVIGVLVYQVMPYTLDPVFDMLGDGILALTLVLALTVAALG